MKRIPIGLDQFVVGFRFNTKLFGSIPEIENKMINGEFDLFFGDRSSQLSVGGDVQPFGTDFQM